MFNGLIWADVLLGNTNFPYKSLTTSMEFLFSIISQLQRRNPEI